MSEKSISHDCDNRVWGFTLIERLVVISIIGFIITAAMVVFSQVRMSSIQFQAEEPGHFY